MGRDKKNEKRERYIGLPNALVRSEAFAALSGNAKALCILMRDRAGILGHQNSQFSLSVREAAAWLHVGKNAAASALQQLQATGVAEVVTMGTVGSEGEGRATTWLFTAVGTAADRRPSQRFLEWKPDAPLPIAKGRGARYPKTGPKSESLSRERDVQAPPCPVRGTVMPETDAKRTSDRDVQAIPCLSHGTLINIHGDSHVPSSPSDKKKVARPYQPTAGARFDAREMADAAGVAWKGLVNEAVRRVRAMDWPPDVKPGLRQDAFYAHVRDVIEERAAAANIVPFKRGGA